MSLRNHTGSRRIALIFAVMLMLALLADADYATFKGDNQRTGNLSGSGPQQPNLFWSASPTGHGYIGAAAAVSGERVFVSNWPDMTFKGELGLACLNRADGKLLWLNPLGGKGGASTPALEDGRIFIGSLTGDIFCVDAGTGETVWNKTIEPDPQWWGVASSPLIQDGVVYVMSFSNGTLHALDLDGEERWILSTGEVSPYLSPAASKGRIYLPGGDPAIYCLNAATGELLWKKDLPSQITATPTLGEVEVFVVVKDSIFALDAENGDVFWSAAINGSMTRLVTRGRMTEETRRAALEHIKPAVGLGKLADRDLVIEATTEQEDVKRKVLAELCAVLRPRTIIGTNTSSISITRLAAATDSPERFMGIHFMNPAPLMELIELVRGIATGDETFEAAKGFVRKLGKTFSVAEDFPAFIVNRILMPMINEAVYTLYEGVGTVEAIDNAMRLGANHPMGPLQLADFIGLDTCLSIM